MGEQSQATAAKEPSAASSKGSPEGAGAQGGGRMPLIVGGIVVLALLGGVGAFLAFPGKVEPGSTISTTPSSGTEKPEGTAATDGTVTPEYSHMTYFGRLLGELPQKNGLGGKVYAASGTELYVINFTFSGTPSDAHFQAGTKSDVDATGDVLRETGKTDEIKKCEGKTIRIVLPRTLSEYRYISIYSSSKGNLGSVLSPRGFGFSVPAAQELAPVILDRAKLSAEAVTLLDSVTVRFFNLKIIDGIHGLFVVAGTGADVKKDTALKLSAKELGKYDGKSDLTEKLPGKTWDQFDWISFMSFKDPVTDMGHVMLPKGTDLIVPLKATGGRRRLYAVKRRGRSGHQILKAEKTKPKILVCTFGESGVMNAMVPEDGMCDVMFYTDMTYDSDKDAIVPRDGGPAFSVLKSAASKYQKTTFGTSMSTGSIAGAVKDKESELTASLDELFSAKLIHFGMLNVENIEDYDYLKDADLEYVKVAAEFLKWKPSDQRYHCALGVSLRDGSKGDKILEVAKQAPRDFPGLTMIILKLHTESGGNDDRWPLAPNPDGVDLSEHSALSLALIKDDLKKELTDIARRGRYAMLSFAMYARSYHMKKTWNTASARQMSESTLNMDYATVCKMGTEKDVTDQQTLYAADEHQRFLALFDSVETFRTKALNVPTRSKRSSHSSTSSCGRPWKIGGSRRSSKTRGDVFAQGSICGGMARRRDSAHPPSRSSDGSPVVKKAPKC